MAQKNKKPPQPRSDNPNNPTCSTSVQILLDLQRAGFPLQQIEELLEFANDNNDKLQKADKIFNEHQYPDNNITFFQGNRDLQITCFLSANEMKILYLMMQNMRKGNLVELSIADIKTYIDISDKTATKALNDLKDKGCIAVQFSRSKTRGTVFMVNPDIAVTGKVKKGELQRIFWHLTGSEFRDRKYIKSRPHEEWTELLKNQKYSRGHDCQTFEDSKYYFNKLNEPDIKKDLPGGASKSKAGNAS